MVELSGAPSDARTTNVEAFRLLLLRLSWADRAEREVRSLPLQRVVAHGTTRSPQMTFILLARY